MEITRRAVAALAGCGCALLVNAQTPALDAWCFASHRRHCSRVRTSRVIRLPVMMTTFRLQRGRQPQPFYSRLDRGGPESRASITILQGGARTHSSLIIDSNRAGISTSRPSLQGCLLPTR